jgi:precorrin-2 dehydrogenase/sirohydrochlorin ferrochelatase
MTPLYHDLAGETVLVFGGGPVGRRKADRFADETRVIVVSPAFDEGLLGLADGADGDCDADPAPPRVELIRAAPDATAVRGWIDRCSPALVVAATDDPAVNAAAEAAALGAGILVNRTDVSGGRDPGSVVVPATVEDGPVRVAISTGGRSPALSKALRQRIESEIEGAGAMAELSGDLRSELAEAGVDPADRRAAIRRVVRSEGVWKGLQKGRSNARTEAYNVIEEVLDR